MPHIKEQSETEDTKRLNPQQELFCRYYATNSELFSNATLAYAEAYQLKLDELSRIAQYAEDGKTVLEPSEFDKAYAVCAVNASRLLKNANVQQRVIELLNEMLRDDVVDAQLAKIILQDYKYESKIRAISEYNKLKQRITDKVDHNIKGSISLTDLFNKSKEE